MKVNKEVYIIFFIAVSLALSCTNKNKDKGKHVGIEKEITDLNIISDLEGSLLPNGEKAELWEDHTNYKRILHVAQNHIKTSDDNDGSKERPFLTIQRAAEVAGPGDMVLIHEGTYRETVRPFNSGRSEKEMIFFKGAEGEKVIVTGAEIFKGPYTKSEGWAPYRSHMGRAKSIEEAVGVGNEDNDQSKGTSSTSEPTDSKPVKWEPYRYSDKDDLFINQNAKAYMFKFPRGTFTDTNPFAMVNGPLIPWVGHENSSSFIYNWAKESTQKKLALMKRGMLFCDGKRLTQVGHYLDMSINPGTFFVEDDGLTIHIRLPDDSHPEDHLIEFTAREQCFCPENRYSSFIRIENISFNKGGNGFSPPQRGIVSTNCGNHFIINNCIIEDANGAGIDIGFQLPARYSLADRGYQSVTNCEINRCGIAGICGTTGCSEIDYYDKQQPTILIAFNRLDDNCWQDFTQLHESAAIKLHHVKNSLLTGNYITGTKYGHAGIWLDAANENTAIRNNVVLNSQECGIYVEASTKVNEVSNNIIINAKEHGIKGSETDHLHCFRNIIMGCKMGGIRIPAPGGFRYFLGQTFTGEGVKTMENVISECDYAICHPSEKGYSDQNLLGNFSSKNLFRLGKAASIEDFDMVRWQTDLKFDLKSVKAEDIKYFLSEDMTGLDISVKKSGKSYDYQFNFNSPLQPQIETFLNDILKNGFDVIPGK
jgi:parallel beta-helix repeat protein